MVVDIQSRVLANQPLGKNNYLIKLEVPSIFRDCLPGQFVMVAPTEYYNPPFPLLRRALAIFSIEGSDKNLLTLLLKIVGDGTKKLASLQAGDFLNMTGPLGQGFDTQIALGRKALIVAGGIGIASLYLLAEQLTQQGNEVTLIYGGRSAKDLVCLDYFENLRLSKILTTEDGSLGLQGRVTKGLETYLPDLSETNTAVYICGPNPMMKAVSDEIVPLGIPCQVSVETKMACGFGVCLGCSVKVDGQYRLACTHGPVFESAGFEWEEDSESRETG